jgi:hypothetical protein
MDPELQTLSVQLADAAIRNTAGAIADRVAAAKRGSVTLKRSLSSRRS